MMHTKRFGRVSLIGKHKLRRMRWIIGGGVALLLMIGHEVVSEQGYLARRNQRQQIEALSREIEGIQKDNEELGARIEDLRSNPAAIEEHAREQLHLARPGEVVITLPDLPEAETPFD
jgi:cell division protein FtsB